MQFNELTDIQIRHLVALDDAFLKGLPKPLKEAAAELAEEQPGAAVQSEDWTPRRPDF